jgi:hypothetical protein
MEIIFVRFPFFIRLRQLDLGYIWKSAQVLRIFWRTTLLKAIHFTKACFSYRHLIFCYIKIQVYYQNSPGSRWPGRPRCRPGRPQGGARSSPGSWSCRSPSSSLYSSPEKLVMAATRILQGKHQLLPGCCIDKHWIYFSCFCRQTLDLTCLISVDKHRTSLV